MSRIDPTKNVATAKSPVENYYFINANTGKVMVALSEEEGGNVEVKTPFNFVVLHDFNKIVQPDKTKTKLFSRAFESNDIEIDFLKEVKPGKFEPVFTGAYSDENTKNFCKINDLKWRTSLVGYDDKGELSQFSIGGMTFSNWLSFKKSLTENIEMDFSIKGFEEVENPKRPEEILYLPIFEPFAVSEKIGTKLMEKEETAKAIKWLDSHIIDREQKATAAKETQPEPPAPKKVTEPEFDRDLPN